MTQYWTEETHNGPVVCTTYPTMKTLGGKKNKSKQIA